MTKTHEEMDKAHTLLALAIQIDTFPTKEDKTRTLIAMSVLCWALGHDHANFFDRILEELQPLQPREVENAVEYWDPREKRMRKVNDGGPGEEVLTRPPSADSLIRIFGDQAYHRGLELAIRAMKDGNRSLNRAFAKANRDLLDRGYGRHPRREVTQ